MRVQDVIKALEAVAPPALAEEGDNVGLILGDASADVRSIMLCVDLTAPVLKEAAASQMVMAYHPPIYKPVSRLTAGASPVLYQALRQGLAVYSVHTALDAAPGGTNDVLVAMLGVESPRPLESTVRQGQCKIVVFVPPEDLSRVADAAFSAGAGRIGNYHDCAFFVHGIGAFCGGPGSHPTLGKPGQHEVNEEMRLEVVAPRGAAGAVCGAIRGAHSYEEPAIDVYPLEDFPDGAGRGRVGKLARPASPAALVAKLKKAAGVRSVLVAPAAGKAAVSTVAFAAGSCGSLYKAALAAGAQLYVTGEMRHHDALAASAAGMTVVCLGHSNSERPALASLADRLRALLPKLKVTLSKADRDPFVIG